MPEMDGYATTHGDPQDAAVRRAADHRADREGDEGRPGEGIESGASDYVTKPVDTDHLLTVMEQWMRAE